MHRHRTVRALEEEQLRPRSRVAGYRATTSTGDVASAFTAERRLARLQRAHQLALDRLRRARATSRG